MVKFMILFHHPANITAFEPRYNEFLALVERIPHIIRRQVISVTGSPQGESPYYRILEIYFADDALMHEALTSPAGQEAGRELFKFPNGTFETLFADVYEEAGGRTESVNGHAGT